MAVRKEVRSRPVCSPMRRLQGRVPREWCVQCVWCVWCVQCVLRVVLAMYVVACGTYGASGCSGHSDGSLKETPAEALGLRYVPAGNSASADASQ
eukprot:5799810-Pleurochrysis_carterae.AAC.1